MEREGLEDGKKGMCHQDWVVFGGLKTYGKCSVSTMKGMSFAKDFSLGVLLPKIQKIMMISSWYFIRDTETMCGFLILRYV